MDAIIALLLIALGGWYWIDSLRARELALQRCHALCREMDVQLLDQTVRIARLRFGRNPQGRVQLRRFYVYEFSTDGEDRWYGLVIVLGQHIEYLRMEHPHGPIIFEH